MHGNDTRRVVDSPPCPAAEPLIAYRSAETGAQAELTAVMTLYLRSSQAVGSHPSIDTQGIC